MLRTQNEKKIKSQENKIFSFEVIVRTNRDKENPAFILSKEFVLGNLNRRSTCSSYLEAIAFLYFFTVMSWENKAKRRLYPVPKKSSSHTLNQS